jgi:Uma2 family endonuclease
MVTFVNEAQRVSVPSWVVDLESFRRWADADDFPADHRICFLKGEVWVDVSKEQVFTHTLVKTRYASVVDHLARTKQLGLYLVDGVRLSNVAANISVKPDGVFLSTETLTSDRVRLVEGMEYGYVEIEGTPDLVLEIVSDSSEQKDLVILREAYWQAGIAEYWLVDARRGPVKFDLLRRGAKGYTAVRKQGGWVRSLVLSHSFRLTQTTSSIGHPDYLLEVR